MSPLSIVMAIMALVFIVMLIRYLFIDPYTLQGTTSAQNMGTISASSLATNGSDVPSTNFAYSIWMYINDWNYRYGETKVVFGRMGAPTVAGQETPELNGISGADPCPVVSLGAVENNLTVSLGCYLGNDASSSSPPNPTGTKTIVHTCSVSNIPIQKWVNVVVSVYGRSMDIYIDGKLVRTCLLPGVAVINGNSNVYVTPSGGFSGWTSKLQYFPTPVNPQQAWNIYSSGYANWTSIFNSYHVQVALVENGTTQGSVTI